MTERSVVRGGDGASQLPPDTRSAALAAGGETADRVRATAPQPPAGERLDPRARTVITVLLVSAFVVILNETIMSVALPVLMADLRVSASVGQWLTAGFLLTLSVVIPITGFLINRYHTRSLFTAAMGLFSTGTLLAAVAPGFPVLLAARVVQASGTAIMIPLLMTTVMTLVPPARRGALMGNISIVISVAPAIGPAVSGLVLSVLSWRFLFWLVLPIALATLLIGRVRITNVGEQAVARIDVLSVVLSVLGFGGLVYGLSSVGQSAGVSAATWVAFAVGAVGLAAFVARQLALQRVGHPLLDLRTFRSRTFTVASLVMMVMFGLLLGSAVLLPIFMQSVQRLSPLVTGLLLLPGGVVMGLLGPVVGRLYDRYGALVPLVPGALAASAAMWSATFFSAGSPAVQVLVFHVLLSVGLAFTFTPLFTAGLGDLPPRLYSFGSAIFSASQQLAGAAGVALLVSVYSLRAASLPGLPEPERIAGGIHTAFLVAAALSVLAVVGSVFVRTPATPPGPPNESVGVSDGGAPNPE